MPSCSWQTAVNARQAAEVRKLRGSGTCSGELTETEARRWPQDAMASHKLVRFETFSPSLLPAQEDSRAFPHDRQSVHLRREESGILPSI